SEASRRSFADYFQHHTEIQFAVRARRAADAVVKQLASRPDKPCGEGRKDGARSKARRLGLGARRRIGIAGVAAAVVTVAVAASVVGWLAIGWPRRGASVLAKGPGANVAWLVNAQDCLWSRTGERPGRSMLAGKSLRLERGLAEIEFDCGARVILQGPAGLELLSGSSARLLQGKLTARVPAHARGFTVLTPHNKVVDLGTEFGLAVDEAGAATVRVFTGEVKAFPLGPASARGADSGVTIHQDQTARLDGRSVDRPSPARGDGEAKYVRAIEPPPIFIPRTLRLDFNDPLPGTLQDADGRGIGLTHRLPGTGADLPDSDPNLRLRPDRHALELTTTRSDINTQERMSTGEYLGVRLSDLGFTGAEDFEIRATIPNIPGLNVVGQFGLYAGTGSDHNIRGGLISLPQPDTYRLFLVNNDGGRDSDIYEVGLTTSGEDLRLTLRRLNGKYSLVVDNLTRNSSSTLAIAHPKFLDGQAELYLGLFGANTQSDARKTLTIRELSVTVWTAQSGSPTMAVSGLPNRVTSRILTP
ncbi:MAG: FecR domain-containing protein, partial [Isosphaeraceae bacterium]